MNAHNLWKITLFDIEKKTKPAILVWTCPDRAAVGAGFLSNQAGDTSKPPKHQHVTNFCFIEGIHTVIAVRWCINRSSPSQRWLIKGNRHRMAFMIPALLGCFWQMQSSTSAQMHTYNKFTMLMRGLRTLSLSLHRCGAEILLGLPEAFAQYICD